MAIPLPLGATQAQQLNQRHQLIEQFSEQYQGLQCFVDPVSFQVMDHDPRECNLNCVNGH